MSRVTNVHSGDRQCMQYNDKNERKKIFKTIHVLEETAWDK